MPWTFAIPYEIPSQNVTARRHWRANHRDVAIVAQLVRGLCWAACNAKGRRTVKLTSYRKQRIKDRANLIGGAKALSDGLVRAGALVDDNDTVAAFIYDQGTLRQMPEQWRDQFNGRACTVIEITDTPAESSAKPPEMGKEVK